MKDKDIRYYDLFWLFIIASWYGLLMEGLYCLFKFGFWENHVVSVYGHFCIIYGVGMVVYYTVSHFINKYNIFLKFLIYASLGTFVELMCGLLLKYALNMMAWSYENSLLNYLGLICLRMFIIWGIFGLVFEKCVPLIKKLVLLTRNKYLNNIGFVFSIFMLFNLSVTSVAILRWADRHNNNSVAHNKITRYIDRKYNDDYMEDRFIEWYFID